VTIDEESLSDSPVEKIESQPEIKRSNMRINIGGETLEIMIIILNGNSNKLYHKAFMI